MSDPWAASPNEDDTRRAQRNERVRQTVARLLLMRGQQRAAAITALSKLELVSTGRWSDEGDDDGVLSVPVDIFDRIDDETTAEISSAARDVVGPLQYGELRLEVQLDDLVAGWDRDLLERLRGLAQPLREATDEATD